ncbi:MAG: Ig-like domain-containing protein, partial [Leptospiraceae bacterium]|nr:Ig-like domain-containing protein [Leptospiraceae bacterium]
MFKKSGVLRSAGQATVLCLAIVAANCSGKTYSTFFQPFDLVFDKNNSTANSTDYVELTGAQPMTTTRVRLTFDEPVTLTAAQTLTNYSIPGLQVLAAIRDATDSRIVYLDTSPQTPGNAYTVTVTNVTGIDGSQMSTSANRMSFTAPQTADKTAPEFSTVAATASTKIFVTFNEALDLSSSQLTANYSLFTDNTCTTGSGITISAAVRQTNQAQVELTTSALGAGPYYLRANGVQDQWGNGTTNLCSAAFTGYTAPAGPKLNGITQQSPTAVIVTFNEDMNMSTGNILANGSYTFGSCGTVTLTTTGVTTVNARAVLLALSAGGTPQNTPCVLTIPGGANLYGTSGVNLDAGSRTITFNYSSAADSTPPQVASVAPVDTNTIRVTFNEPMSAGSISTSSPFSDFSISPSTTITGVTCNGPPVTYCDVDVSPDQSTQTYSVTVQNMTDVAGNNLATTTTSYTGDGRPYIVAITPLDSTHVLVQWSEPIGNAASVGTADYTINLNPGPGTLNITGASLYPTCTDPCSSAYVMLTTAAQTGGSGYTLQVNNPTGSVDNTLPVGNETSATIPGGGGFTGSSGSSAPTVTSASSPASTTVVVNFSEPIDNASIDTTDFAFNVGCPLNGITPTSAVQVSSGVIQLTMPAQAADGACTVTVTGVRDLLENNIAGSNTATFNYLGTTTTGGPGGDTTAPSVVGVYAASNTQIIVSFSEPVTAGTGGNIANYNFSPSLPGASVSCTGAVCTVTVPAGVQSATTYSLTIAGIQDNATPTPNTMASTTVTFGGIGSGGSTAPTMYFAQLVSPQILEVSFSEAMDLSSSQNTAYYTITPASPAQTISSVVRQSDPSKVRITFSPGAYGSGNSFTVTGTANIRDVSLTALTSPMSATFNGFAGAPAAAPDLAATSDTGSSNSDNITNPFPTPGLTFTGTGTPGDTVVLYQNGVAVATAVVNALGNYSVTQATSPGSGTFTYTVATVSPTGVVSSPSLGLNVVVDNVLPTDPATAPTLAAASDTGISNSDAITNLTSNMTVTGTITADATYAQEVDLYDGATLVTTVSVAAGQTTYTFSNLSFTPGAHALTVKVRDIANNSSAAASPTLNLSVDTTAPTLGVTNVVGSNAYIDLPFSEGLYSTSTPPAAAIVQPGAFTITNTGAITVSIQCIKTTTAVGCGAGNDVVAGTSTVRAFLSITGTVTGTESITINSVSTAVFDNAGNAASVTTGAKSLNAVGVPNITGTPTYTSTGATTGYFTVTWDEAPYTNTAASGVLVAGDFTVTFTKNSGNANSASITGFQNGAGGALATGDTTMRILVSFDAATSGVETLQLNAASGQIFSGINPYQNSPTTEQIGPTTAPDAVAPNAPASLDLADADDNGLINNDNITTATSGLTISGTAEANSTVRLYQPNTGGTLLATTTADGTGNWQTDIALAAGSSYTVVATARDAALNVSAASSALTITVDGTNPTAPTGVSVPTYTTTTTTNVSFTAGTDTNITTSNVKMCTANDCNTGCVGATTGNSPVAVSGLIDGTSYYGCVQSRDLAGLTSAWVASAGTVTVDTTNPTV